MTEAIRLSCRSGSTFSMECNSYAAGGRRDDKGRMYIAEVRADAWLAAHANCLNVLDWTPKLGKHDEDRTSQLQPGRVAPAG